jgi:hypothetical protein
MSYITVGQENSGTIQGKRIRFVTKEICEFRSMLK